MTLDEAIIHAENVVWLNDREADRCFRHGGSAYDEKAKTCKACADEHRQLAEWLRELKQLRSEQTDCEYCHEDSDGYIRPIEKNCHASIHATFLRIKANGWNKNVNINFCPMCGRKLGDERN